MSGSKTENVEWFADVPGVGWSSPVVWENRARTELVTLGRGVAISYSLNGKELRRMNRMGGYAIERGGRRLRHRGC